MCSTGTSTDSPTRSIRSRRSQPEDVAGNVEMMISSGSYSPTASIVAVYGSGSPTSPMTSMPVLAHDGAREVDADLGRLEDRVVVDDVPVPRLRARHADDEAASAPPARACARPRAAAGRRASRWRRRGSSSRLPPSVAHVVVVSWCAVAPAGCGTSAPLNTPCTAPGTPYSYGPPTTVGNGVEVEDRRRRGDLPLERQRAPRVGHRARPAAPRRDHVVGEDQRAEARAGTRRSRSRGSSRRTSRRSRRRAAACPARR